MGQKYSDCDGRMSGQIFLVELSSRKNPGWTLVVIITSP